MRVPDKLYVGSGGAWGDRIVQSAALMSFVKAFPDTQVYTPTSCIYENIPEVIVASPSEAFEQGCRDSVRMRYGRNFRKIPKDGIVKSYYEMSYRDLERKLGITLPRGVNRGVIVLSDEEKQRPSIVPEKPYWVLFTHGKKRSKDWGKENYQELVNLLKDEVTFVSVGKRGKGHELDGVVDIRGLTSRRELLSVVHHADGCIGAVGNVTHLSASVPTVDGNFDRPFICIFGGREDPALYPYEHMRVFSTIGQFPCCEKNGCFSRTRRCDNEEYKHMTPHPCYKAITADMVAESVRDIITNDAVKV